MSDVLENEGASDDCIKRDLNLSFDGPEKTPDAFQESRSTEGKLSSPQVPHSTKPAGVESKTECDEHNDEYQVISSTQEKFSLNHPKHELYQKDILPPHTPSVSVQSPDSPRSGKAHVPSGQSPDCMESGRDSSHRKSKNVFSTPRGKNFNTTRKAEDFEQEHEFFHTSPHYTMQEDLPHKGALYLPAGWYINIGGAYCAGCQMHGTG